MTSTVIGRKFFSICDQEGFANFSGDCNPMHMDALAARRTQAGQPVVHGVHAFLWALDILCHKGFELSDLASVHAKFTKFAYLNREITLCAHTQTKDSLKLEIVDDDTSLMTFKLSFNPEKVDLESVIREPSVTAPLSTPREIDINDMKSINGLLQRETHLSQSDKLFDHLTSKFGSAKVMSIAQMSTIVGMHCPGLHSIFSSFKLRFGNMLSNTSKLIFEVQNTDSRFQLINMAIEGHDFNGTLEAFVRQKPLESVPMAEIYENLPKNCFADVHALVIGGSRGLGEATAKILAAGGARVTITYAQGKSDADKIAKEINSTGSENQCEIMKYNALEHSVDQLKHLKKQPDYIFYFATSQIFRQKKNDFNYSLFQEFNKIYIDGFYQICKYMLSIRSQPLSIFYPSSIAVTDRPKGMTEYAMAKSAGEQLCADLCHIFPLLKISINRLPRAKTDQTATVTPVESVSAIDLMLPIIRDLVTNSKGTTGLKTT